VLGWLDGTALPVSAWWVGEIRVHVGSFWCPVNEKKREKKRRIVLYSGTARSLIRRIEQALDNDALSSAHVPREEEKDSVVVGSKGSEGSDATLFLWSWVPKRW
jgi:hypothetical protein